MGAEAGHLGVRIYETELSLDGLRQSYENLGAVEFDPLPADVANGFWFVSTVDGFSNAVEREVVWKESVHTGWASGEKVLNIVVEQEAMGIATPTLQRWAIEAIQHVNERM